MSFKQIKPQKAKGRLVESIWDDSDWIAEEKFDGDRRIAQFCGGLVRFTGGKESVDGTGFVEKTHNVPHLSKSYDVERRDVDEAMLARVKALEGTVLDGEMIFTGKAGKGGRSKCVTSIMGSGPEEAVRKQRERERGWLQYVVFDCLYYKGADVRARPLWQRRQFAQKAVAEWRNEFVSACNADAGAKRRFLTKIMARGGEGVVLKHIEHRYGNEKLWVKVKGEWTADCVIMGYKAAKEVSKKVNGEKSMTKYAKAGMIGAVVLGQYRGRALVEVATISGFPDYLRSDFTTEGKKYLGAVVRIKHNGREPTGRFRHPRWDCFREDKNAKDCVLDLEET